MKKFVVPSAASAARAAMARATATRASAVLACLLASVFAGVPASAGEEKVQIVAAPGVEQVRANCIACHSLDYIQMNSPFLDRKGWEAAITKMEKAFAAPIKAEDKEAMLNYLSTNYGKK